LIGTVVVGAIAYGFALEGLAATLLVALALVALKQPAVAIFGCTFAIFTNSPMVLAGAVGFTGLTEVIFAILLVLAFTDFLKGTPITGRVIFPLLIILLFFATIFGSILSSNFVDATATGVADLGRFVALGCALILAINSPSRFSAAIFGILAGAVFLSSLTVAQYALQLKQQTFFGYAANHITYMFGVIDEVRFGGPVGEPNFYAQILLLAYPISLCLAIANLGRGRIIFLACSAIVLAGIILTQSRGGLVSLAVVTVLATFTLRVRAPAVLTMVFALATMSVLVLSSDAGERVTTAIQDVRTVVTLEGNVTDEAISGRISEMLAAWYLFLENPWFGTGYDTFERLYQDTARRFDLMARGENRQSHSLVLEILAERGAVGFFAWCCFLWFAFSSAVSGKREFARQGYKLGEAACAGLVIALIGKLLTSIFLHEAFAWYFWLVVALAFAAPNAAHRFASRT
jgi:putative inorganic carbon (hco3(-)) transporter